MNGQTPPSGLILYLPFNGNANDASGNGNNATFSNAVLTADRFGSANKAYFFNGNSKIVVPNSTSLSSPTTAFSSSVWVKITDFGTYTHTPIFCKSDSWVNAFQYALWLNSNEVVVQFNVWNKELHVPYNFSLNTWYHIVTTFQSGFVIIYINGEEIGSGSGNLDMSILPDNNDFVIGANIPGAVEYFNGCIDDVRLYNITLSETEVKRLFDRESCNILTTFYKDEDGDGYGNPSVTTQACTAPQGYVANNTDCNDNDNTKWRSRTLHVDSDGDGYTNGTATICYGSNIPTGYKESSLGNDCDDTKTSVNPGATEVCGNGIDDNCNGQIDENCGCTLAISLPACHTVYIGYPPLSSVVLTANTTGASNPTYRWSTGATTKSITVSPTVQQTYSVTVTDGPNCTKTASTVVKVVDVRCGNGNRKVQVCHNPAAKQPLCVDQTEAAILLAREGNKLGKCNSTTGCGTNTRNLVVNPTYNRDVKMYPNPARDIINFEFDHTFSNGSVKIYDLQGKLIISNVLSEGSLTHQINMKSIQAKGIYMVHILLDDESFIEKLIME